MNKNKISDFDELVVKGQRLNKHFGESGLSTNNLVRGVCVDYNSHYIFPNLNYCLSDQIGR